MTTTIPPQAGGAAQNKPYKVLVLPGDHVGPEVMVEALKVFDVVAKHLEPQGITFQLDNDIIGGGSIDKEGTPVTDRVLEKAKNADAVLFGSVGGPEWQVRLPFLFLCSALVCEFRLLQERETGRCYKDDEQ